MRWGALAIVAVLARGTVAAPAPRERAALAAIDLGPKVPGYVRAKATTQIEEGLAAAGYAVLPTTQVAPHVTGELATCREGACVRSVAAALGVDAVVFASITSKDDSSVILMRVYDASSGLKIAEVHEVCELCGEAELAERLGIAASALRAQAAEAREQKARLAVSPPPHSVVQQPEPPQHSLAPGIAVGATGAAALGVGIYLIAINGHGTCSAGDQPVYPAPGAVIRYPDPSNPGAFVCRDIYRTKTLGWIGAGVGLAAIAAGVTLVVRARHHDRALEIEPTPGGASVKVSLSW